VKPPFIVAIALAFCIYFAPRSEAQNRSTTQAHARPQQTQPESLAVPVQIGNQRIFNETATGKDQAPLGDETPEWVLVGVGIVTAFVIGWQSLETRRAANAAIQGNVDAMEANAATLVEVRRQADLQERAIRPWVGTAFISHGTLISQSNIPQVGARITLRNTGPSVALKGFMLPYLISSKHDVLPNAIKDSWEKMGEVLGSQAAWNTGFVLHPGTKHYQNASMGPFTDLSMDEILNGTCYILVCVEYRDQFDRRHRTQDCFRIMPELQAPFNVNFEVVPAYQTAD